MAGLDREPGENRERELAVQLEIAPGAIAHGLGDVVLVVIRIDERDHRDARQHQQHDYAENRPARYLQAPHPYSSVRITHHPGAMRLPFYA